MSAAMALSDIPEADSPAASEEAPADTHLFTDIHMSRAMVLTPAAPAFCIDTGAPKSVIGTSTLHRLFPRGSSPRVFQSSNKFRFGDVSVA